MSCTICRNFTKKQLRRISKSYEAGETPETIAATMSANYDDMISHCTECLNDEEETTPKILRELVPQLKDLLEIAKSAYKKNPNRSDVAQAYARLVTEVRDTLEQLDKLKNPEENIRSIVKVALDPLIRKSVIHVTTEIAKLKADLITSGADVTLVDDVTKQAILSYGQSMQTSLVEIVERLCKHYGIAKKDISKIVSSSSIVDHSKN